MGEEMKRPLALIFLLLFSFGCAQRPAPTAAMPDGTLVQLETASSPGQIVQGLSGRDTLCENCGMLFVFGKPGPCSFWMHGMRFPLDIIFLDEHGKVLNIAKSLAPCESGAGCPSYNSSGDALLVLEVNAGFASRHGLEPGSRMLLVG